MTTASAWTWSLESRRAGGARTSLTAPPNRQTIRLRVTRRWRQAARRPPRGRARSAEPSARERAAHPGRSRGERASPQPPGSAPRRQGPGPTSRGSRPRPPHSAALTGAARPAQGQRQRRASTRCPSHLRLRSHRRSGPCSGRAGTVVRGGLAPDGVRERPHRRRVSCLPPSHPGGPHPDEPLPGGSAAPGSAHGPAGHAQPAGHGAVRLARPAPRRWTAGAGRRRPQR